MGTLRLRGAVNLEFGDRQPIALELDRLLVSHKPIQYEYAPRFDGIVFGPEHLTLPLIQRWLVAGKAAEERPVRPPFGSAGSRRS